MLMLPHSSYNSESSFSNCSMTHSSDFPLGYNSLVAIQSSAFLMTLYRKKIITGKTHMLVYSGCLVLSSYHIIRLLDSYTVFLATRAFITRIKTPINKYLIWGTFQTDYRMFKYFKPDFYKYLK